MHFEIKSVSLRAFSIFWVAKGRDGNRQKMWKVEILWHRSLELTVLGKAGWRIVQFTGMSSDPFPHSRLTCLQPPRKFSSSKTHENRLIERGASDDVRIFIVGLPPLLLRRVSVSYSFCRIFSMMRTKDSRVAANPFELLACFHRKVQPSITDVMSSLSGLSVAWAYPNQKWIETRSTNHPSLKAFIVSTRPGACLSIALYVCSPRLTLK